MKMVGFETVEFRTGRRAQLAPRPQRVLAKSLDLMLAIVCASVIAALVDASISEWLKNQGFVALPGWTLIACSIALAVSVVFDLVGLVAGFGSVGKWALGLRVVSAYSGEKPMVRQALSRAVAALCVTIGMIVAWCIPFLWAVIIGWMVFLAFGSWMLWILSLCVQWLLLTKDTRQAIHDRAAKTVVVSSGHPARGSWLMTLWR